MEHFGAMCMFNTKSLEYRDKSLPKSIRYVSISVLMKSVAFEDIQIRDHPLEDEAAHQPPSQPGLFSKVINWITGTAPPCPDGFLCDRIGDPDHNKTNSHPINNPCDDAENCKILYRTDNADHVEKYSHPCRYGFACRDRKNEEHCKKFIHIKHEKCKLGKGCDKLSEWQHREQFSHENLPDFLIPCKYGKKCNDITKPDHLIKFKHM